MPLDPKTAAWLEKVNAADTTPMYEMPVDRAREAFEKLSVRSGLAPVEIGSIDDTVVPGPAGDISVRIYSPAGDGPFPVLVYFPGGGFVVGSPASVEGPCTVWARDAGVVIVSVDYRKGPEDPFPAAVDDAVAVTRWVGKNAAQFGGDPARIVVAGDSAGGNLAAVVSIDARDNGGPGIAGQILIYPTTDVSKGYPSTKENGTGYFIDIPTLRWFGKGYAADPTDWRASPLLADDHSGLPRALVITAEFDPLRDQGDVYAQALSDAGVEVTHSRYDGEIHAFVANLAGVTGRGAEAVEEVTQFLRTALA